LTLKEPSTSAWEEFAEAQKKAAAEKSGRTSVVGVPGVSSQKLPDFVPKTNSKWDGLTENAKRKSMNTKSKDKSHRSSTSTRQTTRSGLSSGSGGSDRSAARKFGSLSSRPQAAVSLHSKHGSVQSRSSSGEPGRLGYSVPAPTAVHPALRDNAATPWEDAPEPRIMHGALQNSTVTPWEEPAEPEAEPMEASESSPQTFLYPPSPPPGLVELPIFLPTPELELPQTPFHAEFGTSLHLMSANASPQTSPDMVEQYPFVLYGDPNEPVEGSGTFWHSDTDNEESAVSKSAGLKAPLNFSRPRRMRSPTLKLDEELPTTIQEEDEEADTLQSTLRNWNGRTAPFIFEPLAAQSRQASAFSHAAPPTMRARTSSRSSRVTDITITSVSTVTQPMRSPTFSEVPSDSTRPSTAASTVTAATAHRRDSLSMARSDSDTPSFASSEMSVQWTMSPKERLGLGGRMIRRGTDDALPWDMNDRPKSSMLSDAAAKRQSGLSQSSQDAGKLKRLSIKWGMK